MCANFCIFGRDAGFTMLARLVLNSFIPAFDKEVKFKVTYMKDLGTYAAWKATKTTGQFDLKTFEVKAVPVEKVEGLRPGMSAIIEK